MGKNIRPFKSFKATRRFDAVNEAVTEVGNVLKISNVEIKKSDVKSYINQVKQELDRDLSVERSLSEIAEDMVKYALDNGNPLNELPTNALLGGEPEMAQDTIETGEIDVDAELEPAAEVEAPVDDFEEPAAEVDEVPEEGLEDLEGEGEVEGEVETEAPVEGEETPGLEEEEEGEEGEVTDEEGEGEEEEELPI